MLDEEVHERGVYTEQPVIEHNLLFRFILLICDKQARKCNAILFKLFKLNYTAKQLQIHIVG